MTLWQESRSTIAEVAGFTEEDTELYGKGPDGTFEIDTLAGNMDTGPGFGGTPNVCDGCLVGQAIGDMMGLPYENLSARRIGRIAKFERPRFIFGYGCGSDDTEHAGLTADAIEFSGGDVGRFRARLASNLRWWFLAGPPGIGFATAKACLRLCLGISPSKSGIPSAGNGPAMRAAILGVRIADDRLEAFVTASTMLTHTDPRALAGSLLIAELARSAPGIDRRTGSAWLRSFVKRWNEQPTLEPLTGNLLRAADGLDESLTVGEFAQRLGLVRGVSGFIAHTVPVAAFAFFRHADDYRAGIEAVIRAGGDTDTVAAITGALIGARVGVEKIPMGWRRGHRDWPWSLRRLISRTRPSPLLWPMIVLRNFTFFGIVLGHVIRRMLPPW